jgi:hypothetical protein
MVYPEVGVTEVKMIDWQPWQAIDVAKELQTKGYVMGMDFEWEYHKPKYDDTTYEAVHNRFTIFRFYKDEIATWFTLKYG